MQHFTFTGNENEFLNYSSKRKGKRTSKKAMPK